MIVCNVSCKLENESKRKKAFDGVWGRCISRTTDVSGCEFKYMFFNWNLKCLVLFLYYWHSDNQKRPKTPFGFVSSTEVHKTDHICVALNIQLKFFDYNLFSRQRVENSFILQLKAGIYVPLVFINHKAFFAGEIVFTFLALVIVCNPSASSENKSKRKKSSQRCVRSLHQQNDRGQWVWD